LSRNEAGELVGLPIKLPAGMKAKNYRQNFRRAIAEAMLGQGVIVGEGVTERDALLVVAQRMEAADQDRFPLDVAGIAVISADGDGNLEKLGAFFKEIGVPAFALFDRKNRTDDDIAALEGLYVVARQIAQKGAETLMAAETPLDRQWLYLDALRAEDTEGRFGIPAVRPADDTLRALTISTLKGLKGEGGAARLLELCDTHELPPTIVAFMQEVYARYPRPKRKLLNAAVEGAAVAGIEAPPDDAAGG